MERAKAAVSDFLSKDGKHRTTVDQDHSQAITEEHVLPHRHENATTAIDREVHKDHHYTTIQPVTHKETLPEQHHHNIIPVEHKTVDHGGHDEMTSTLERDASKFQDTSTTHQTTHSQTAVPVMAGEHVHHHVHEHVQPVIHKETVQPHVVHTTIPIHETHHVAPVHHGTKIAPTKTLDEFTSGGGILKGRSTKDLYEYEGCPETDSSASHKHGLGKTAAGTAGVAAATTAASHHHHGKSATGETLADGTTTGQTGNAAFGTSTAGTATAAGDRDSTAFDSGTSGTGEDVSRLADTLGTRNRQGVSGSTRNQSDPVNSQGNNHTGSKAAEGATVGALGAGLAAETHSGNKNREGHMFGKDKVRDFDNTNNTNTANPTTATGTESRSFLKEKNDPNFLAKERKNLNDSTLSNNNYKTTGTAGNNAATGTGSRPLDGSSIPRTDPLGTTTDSQVTGGMEPWRAGELHSTKTTEGMQSGVQHKASLVDKINPFKDADGDGKKGFMK